METPTNDVPTTEAQIVSIIRPADPNIPPVGCGTFARVDLIIVYEADCSGWGRAGKPGGVNNQQA